MRRNGKTQQTADTTMQTDAAMMQTDAAMMQADVVMTQADATMMQADVVMTQAGAITMQADAVMVQAGAITMQAGGVTPQPSVRSRRHITRYRRGTSIDKRLMAAQVALDAVLEDAALQSALALCGYDLAQILEGKALRDQAQALSQQQQARAGDQLSAMDARAAAQAQAHALYMRQIKLARVALRNDPGAAKTLDLAAARKRSSAGWLTQAQKFYANALKDAAILAKLAARRDARAA